MKRKGKFRNLFPGGNTSRGFYSFYDYVIEPEAKRIFVIKGGPGVGKSSLMRQIGQVMLNEAFDIEFHYCSLDNNSLDAIVIPALRIAMIDGTAPHIVDPKHPAVVDEIINLGEHWEEAHIRPYRDTLLKLNQQIKLYFRHAYQCLTQARLFNDEVESYYQDCHCLDYCGLNTLADNLIFKIFTSRQMGVAQARHLFASAITPGGLVNYFPTIFDHVGQRYVLTGRPGTGKATILKKIYETARNWGYDCEAFHCALEPTHLEHLIIPVLNTAIITSNQFHAYTQDDSQVINTDAYLDCSKLTGFVTDLEAAQVCFQEALTRALSFLNRAKKTHDEVETYYIAGMKFTEVNAKREEILQRILSYAAEPPVTI
jgi:energy-coupling factor transporter ATP-binding protein EcfA2